MKPKKYKNSLYLTQEMKEEVLKLADDTERTFNGMVVEMIKKYLEQVK